MNKLKIIMVSIIGLLLTCSVLAQGNMPKIMVIPFTKDGEDLRTVLDENVNTRIAITKVKEGFDSRGFSTVDFVGRLKAAKDNQIFTSDNQSDIKSKIIELSGCDAFVVVEASSKTEGAFSSASVIISSYESSTGNSLANKVSNSGRFETTDSERLVGKAVDKCMDEFVGVVIDKFAEIVRTGRSAFVDCSFGENSSYNMSSQFGDSKTALSELLEDWFSNNAYKNNYHVQGITNLKMILDDVKIPLRDKNNFYYTSNKFAVDITKYLKTLGLDAVKDVKGNTIYITIN